MIVEQESSTMARVQESRSNAGGIAAEIYWVSWRSFKKLTRNPFLVFFSLFMPLMWLVMFSQTFSAVFSRGASFGRALPYDFVAVYLPAVMIMTAIQSASQSGMALVADIDSGFMDKFLVAPVSRTSVLFGKLLADGLRMALQSSIVLMIAYLMKLLFGWRIPFATGFVGAAAVVLLAMSFGIAFAGLSNAVALKTRNTEATMMVSFTLIFPLQFLSSAMLPAQLLPKWVQNFAMFNPVSYVADAARELILAGWDWTLIGKALLAVGAFGVLLNGIAVMAFRSQSKLISLI